MGDEELVLRCEFPASNESIRWAALSYLRLSGVAAPRSASDLAEAIVRECRAKDELKRMFVSGMLESDVTSDERAEVVRTIEISYKSYCAGQLLVKADVELNLIRNLYPKQLENWVCTTLVGGSTAFDFRTRSAVVAPLLEELTSIRRDGNRCLWDVMNVYASIVETIGAFENVEDTRLSTEVLQQVIGEAAKLESTISSASPMNLCNVVFGSNVVAQAGRIGTELYKLRNLAQVHCNAPGPFKMSIDRILRPINAFISSLNSLRKDGDWNRLWAEGIEILTSVDTQFADAPRLGILAAELLEVALELLLRNASNQHINARIEICAELSFAHFLAGDLAEHKYYLAMAQKLFRRNGIDPVASRPLVQYLNALSQMTWGGRYRRCDLRSDNSNDTNEPHQELSLISTGAVLLSAPAQQFCVTTTPQAISELQGNQTRALVGTVTTSVAAAVLTGATAAGIVMSISAVTATTAVAAAEGAAVVGVTAALVSNPVGWAILAVLAGVGLIVGVPLGIAKFSMMRKRTDRKMEDAKMYNNAIVRALAAFNEHNFVEFLKICSNIQYTDAEWYEYGVIAAMKRKASNLYRSFVSSVFGGNQPREDAPSGEKKVLFEFEENATTRKLTISVDYLGLPRVLLGFGVRPDSVAYILSCIADALFNTSPHFDEDYAVYDPITLAKSILAMLCKDDSDYKNYIEGKTKSVPEFNIKKRCADIDARLNDKSVNTNTFELSNGEKLWCYATGIPEEHYAASKKLSITDRYEEIIELSSVNLTLFQLMGRIDKPRAFDEVDADHFRQSSVKLLEVVRRRESHAQFYSESRFSAFRHRTRLVSNLCALFFPELTTLLLAISESPFLSQVVDQPQPEPRPVTKDICNKLAQLQQRVFKPLSKNVDGRSRHVLSLGGGGARGIITARILLELEHRCQRPISSLFGTIAGTSTGAMIGASLCVPEANTSHPKISTAAVVQMYAQESEQLFANGRSFISHLLVGPKYDDKYLNKQLELTFGKLTLAGSLSRVIMPASQLTDKTVVWFDSVGTRATTLLRDATRAAVSAQSYFPTFTLNGESFGDAGLIANNPAHELCTRLQLKPAETFLLSIDTGMTPTPVSMGRDSQLDVARAISSNAAISTQGAHESVQHFFREHPSNYVRLQPTLPRKYPLDVSSPADMLELLNVAEIFVAENDELLKSIADRLIGKKVEEAGKEAGVNDEQ